VIRKRSLVSIDAGLGNELAMLAKAMMSSARGGDLHGREAELALIQRTRTGRRGNGAVNLPKAAPGWERVDCRQEVADTARTLGFAIGIAAAEPSERVGLGRIPAAPLMGTGRPARASRAELSRNNGSGC
jgi:hypothetical protein